MKITNSKILRRSGESVVEVCRLLEWRPDAVIQAGVGVHYGEVSAMYQAWEGCSFIGIEPHPHMDLSNYPGPVYRYALGAKRKEEVHLYSKPNHKDGSSLYPISSSCSPIPVIQETLDNIVEYNGYDFRRANTLLWIDCEGSELNVLRGAVETLRWADMVNIEMTGKPYHEKWSSPLDVHRILDDAGFLLQWTHTHRTSIGQYDAIYVVPQLFKAEFCSCPYTLEKINGKERVG